MKWRHASWHGVRIVILSKLLKGYTSLSLFVQWRRGIPHPLDLCEDSMSQSQVLRAILRALLLFLAPRSLPAPHSTLVPHSDSRSALLRTVLCWILRG